MASESNELLSLGWFLVLAIIFHGLFLQWPVKVVPDSSVVTEANKDPILVEKYPGEARKPVVETSKAIDDPVAKDKTAKYAGEFRNRVEKEMQSAAKGKFQEGQVVQRATPEGQTGKHGTGSGAEASIPHPDGEIPKSSAEGREGETEDKGPKMSDLMIVGKNPHYFPKDIQEGNQTVLNTDKVLYASFMNRIAEEIYDPWVSALREAMHTLQIEGKKLEANSYITKLNVTMDKDGTITGITVLASCGVVEIDDAPKKAFWRSEHFPNPPSQLIEEDGYIRLGYEFHYEYKSSGFNIVPWTI